MNAHKADGYFNSPSKGKLSFSLVLDEIVSYVTQQPESAYKLVIGTDSKANGVNGVGKTEFVTALIIHRVGHGGRYFWHKDTQDKRLYLRDRIYTEVFKSISLAQKLEPELVRLLPKDQYNLEIHIDVGPNGPTRDMIKEVVGMVTGNGYHAKTKPHSYGASIVADKHT